jgi:maltose alpha-D-glucosyltransferase/alpha-amylase
MRTKTPNGKTPNGKTTNGRNGGNGGEGLTPDPLWYRTAVIYEIPVRAFCDSNEDGWGDLPGLISKLDYLRDLGVTALWLLPFYPSPMRDGGYDIADYTGVHPLFGTLDDFKRLLEQAHARGLRIITELVINHTSKDHPWFERARRSPPGSRYRDYYVWSDTPDRYADARVIFKDFETSNWTWDPVAKAYYWHRFYGHQPDLNFDNPEVHDAIFSVVDFWLDLGVDGMRLDAVPYLFEREGTSCENLPETHAFLRKLRAHVDGKYRDRMLLAEANQWPADAAAYFGQGDECHMNFHFPLMPRIFMSLLLEDRFPIVDILRQTPTVPDTCQWATFLRNHDELTLEMVTEEDRDYMYRVYADEPMARLNLGIRRRLAPLLKSRPKIELVNSLLFSLPGTPVIYYGDEIGMGDNIFLADRDGVRTPMQWSGDRNAGFSRANPQKVLVPVITDPSYHYEAVNVEAQEANLHSLLWWTKRLIAVARRNRELGNGAIEFLQPENHKILAYKRIRGQNQVLCVANLSRFPQYVELELTGCEGLVPVEIFSNVRFPVIGKTAYLLTMAPHAFFWFRLEPAVAQVDGVGRLALSAPLAELFAPGGDPEIANMLLRYVRQRRWFRGKDRAIKEVRIVDQLPLGTDDDPVTVMLEVEYTAGEPETYPMALVVHRGDEMARRQQAAPHAIVALVDEPDAESEGGAAAPEAEALPGGTSADVSALTPPREEIGLFDAFATGEITWTLLEAISGRRIVQGATGQLRGDGGAELRALLGEDPRPLVRAPELEQTNTVTMVGQKALVKIYRQVEQALNVELEVGAFLSARMQEPLAPKILGSLEYQRGGSSGLVSLVQEFVPNEGDAWRLTLGEIELFFDAVLSARPSAAPELPPRSLVAASKAPPPAIMQEMCGRYFGLARQLARRTVDVHLLLASDPESPEFRPEPFTAQHQQSIQQRSHVHLMRAFESLRRRLDRLPPQTREAAEKLLGREQALDDRLRRISSSRVQVSRIRCHGDLHLGQVLFTGNDFVFIDFEGEPARPMNERRYKRCVLRDAVGMIRSFSYAAESVLRGGQVRPQDVPALVPWATAWTEWVSAAYLGAYLQGLAGTPLLPTSDAHIDLLLDFYELEKVIYEVQYELNNRPDWLAIPLAGMARIEQRGQE